MLLRGRGWPSLSCLSPVPRSLETREGRASGDSQRGSPARTVTSKPVVLCLVGPGEASGEGEWKARELLLSFFVVGPLSARRSVRTKEGRSLRRRQYSSTSRLAPHRQRTHSCHTEAVCQTQSWVTKGSLGKIPRRMSSRGSHLCGPTKKEKAFSFFFSFFLFFLFSCRCGVSSTWPRAVLT